MKPFVNVLSFILLVLCLTYVRSSIIGDGIKNGTKDDVHEVGEIVEDDDDVLYFYDDDENLVQATLDIPSVAEMATFSIADKIRFTLFTKERVQGEPITFDDKTFKTTKFNPKRETVFITHGWINSERSAACTLIRDAYLKKVDYNIIVIDWSGISMRPYGWAATRVINVGKRVASMIDFMESQGLDLNKTRLVGHSLGAHVVGLGAHYAKNTVNYVVGLDPALPLFYLASSGSRISTTDAKNVEIIHTNAGKLGMSDPVGHTDFYPNGGRKQPGCIGKKGGACAHSRSYEFYAESIVSDKGFFGKGCNSHLKMGFEFCHGDTYTMGGMKEVLEKTGMYYLKTRKHRPFAMGELYK